MNRYKDAITFCALYTILVAMFVRHYVGEIDKKEAVRDAELLLKASRLQDLVLPEQQEIIDELTYTWTNDPYRTIPIVRFGWWHNRTNTSSP